MVKKTPFSISSIFTTFAIMHTENGVKRLVSEVNVFVVNGKSVMYDPSKMKIWWHVHNDVELDGIFSSTKVSPADFNIQKDMKSMGYKGNSFIVD